MIIHLTSLVTWLCFREDFLHVGLHHLCNLWHGNNDYNYRAGQVGQFPPSFITSKLYSANDPDWHFSFFHLYLFEGGSMPRVGERCRSWELRFRLSWSWRTLWRSSVSRQVRTARCGHQHFYLTEKTQRETTSPLISTSAPIWPSWRRTLLSSRKENTVKDWKISTSNNLTGYVALI